jgi:SnoaL-like protein
MTMAKRRTWLSWIGIIACAAVVPGGAQAGQGKGSMLTDQDRAQIQDLVARYARALGSCAAEEYADLFAPAGGYFASSVRGEVAGREKLIELVRSERQCSTPTITAPNPANGPANAARRAPTVPTAVIEASSDGVVGKVTLGNAGRYDDVYVKTPNGWRFQARDFISGQEEAAKLTGKDFIEIRRLAGNDRGYFDDTYVDTPQGKRFRSAGLVVTASPEGAIGKAYLRNDGGHYEDVYVRSPNGWRFRSRAYVAAPTAPAAADAKP